MIILNMAERFAELSTIAFSIFFMYRVLDTKIGKKQQVIAGLIYAAIRMAYYLSGLEFRPYFAIIAGIIYGYFVFAGKIRTLTIWNVVFVVVEGIADTAVISVYLLLPDTSVAQMAAPGTDRIILILISKLVQIAAYYLVTMKNEKADITSWQDGLLLAAVPIGALVMTEIVFRYGDTLPPEQTRIFMAIGSVVLLLIVTCVVILYNRITANNRELASSKLQLKMSEMTQEHIHQINDIYSQLSSIRHDLRNHFLAIRSYLNAKDYDALQKYVDDLTDVNLESIEVVKHPVLNALISTRAAMAKHLNIDFEAKIVIPQELPVNDVDLCILISNLLDNAFEANDKVISPRYISLNARLVNSYWVIACRNATKTSGSFSSSGSLKSTKEDAGIHGIGTKQIQEIAEKTGGFVTYRNKNFEFSTLVMLKLPGEYGSRETEVDAGILLLHEESKGESI